jgi:cytochrome c oxidase cbb3-type subunit III
MKSIAAIRRLALCAMCALLATACDREERRFSESPPTATAEGVVTQTVLQPGTPLPKIDVVNAYDGNAYAIGEGNRLYNWMNCVGCHAHGGGAIGPPLMDDKWIYGSEPENIFATIVEGRPNGMPSFRGKLSNQQVWQLVAYVRNMSGLTPMLARPSREDDMHIFASSITQKPEKPKQAGLPGASEKP